MKIEGCLENLLNMKFVFVLNRLSVLNFTILMS